MKNKLYLVYPEGYPEDYALIYADTELMVVKNYCEWYGVDDSITVDEFYESYVVDNVNKICGKEIEKIVFK